MSIQIINYTEVCSNALLAIIDNNESSIKKLDDGRYEIIIDRNFKTLIDFYIKSFCKNHQQFGKKTVFVKTCRPMNNWRQEERGSAIKASRYHITDVDSFVIDKIQLENILEKSWTTISNKLKQFQFIECPSVDFIDICYIIKNFIIDVTIVPSHFYFIRDINNEYMHMEKIPNRITTEVEIVLRGNKLIL